MTGTSPSDCLVSYPGHSLGGESYSSAEKQSVYSTTPADWATGDVKSPTDVYGIQNQGENDIYTGNRVTV